MPDPCLTSQLITDNPKTFTRTAIIHVCMRAGFKSCLSSDAFDIIVRKVGWNGTLIYKKERLQINQNTNWIKDCLKCEQVCSSCIYIINVNLPILEPQQQSFCCKTWNCGDFF